MRFTARCWLLALAAALAALALAPGLALAARRSHPAGQPARHPARRLAVHKQPRATGPASSHVGTSAPGTSQPGASQQASARRTELRAQRESAAARRQAKAHAGGLSLSVSHDGTVFAGIAHATAAAADQIIDFAFSPSTMTIHVGDTVTWTNVGKAPHSATANDHSFNTGILQPGQSGSHTFTAAGTFTYYCIVHPWMHGTITVLAATTTTTPSRSGSAGSHTTNTTPTSTTSATSDTNSADSLPMTGIDLSAVLACGLTLTAAGGLVRRRLRASSPPTPR